jgi:hypothetical protein
MWSIRAVLLVEPELLAEITKPVVELFISAGVQVSPHNALEPP